MALESGTKLGTYEISDLLGKGGMGEVYRARDTKLGREVAIKVLPAEFAQDAERLARLEREARMLAALNHPNIAAIHGLEESDDTRFLVLELIEGDTLADRLKGGAITVEESLRLALQIAEALEAAHEKGVVHRDLKPANIKVTPDGRVKVLDFGLAKAFIGDQADVDLSNSPTMSMAATQQGVILGTAAYMSPEQASGEVADHRTDLWAFGVVLFEMLAGRELFSGKTVTHVLASVMKEEPNWDLLPRNLPPRIRFLVERCLEKEAKDRCPAIAEARVEIAKVIAEPEDRSHAEARPAVATGPHRLAWAASVLVAVAVTAALTWIVRTPAPTPVTRFSFDLPAGEVITGRIAVSPDGRSVAVDTETGTYIREAGQFELRPLVGAEDAGNLFFSADGLWLGYLSANDGALKKIPVGGGPPVTIAADVGTFGPGTWRADGTIVFASPTDGYLYTVSENGGIPEALTGPGELLAFPNALPGTDVLLATQVAAPDISGLLAAQIVLRTPGSDESRPLFPGVAARYAPTGHLIFSDLNTSTLFAVPFDLDRLEVTGGPVGLVQGVQGAQWGVSAAGTLAYRPGQVTISDIGTSVVAYVRRDGTSMPLSLPGNPYLNPRVSPDGLELAVEIASDDGSFISVYDLSGNTAMQRLTVEGNNSQPVWSPDGERIAYASDGGGEAGIFWRPADGSGVAERLTTAGDGLIDVPESFSPDGQWLSFRRTTALAQAASGVWILSMETREATAFADIPDSIEYASAFSPDGEWLTYASTGGTLQGAADLRLYAEPFPQTGERRQIGENSGAYGIWSQDGSELIYRRANSGNVVGIRVSTDPTFSFTTEQELFAGVVNAPGNRNFDIMPDGERFIAVLSSASLTSEGVGSGVNVVLNWHQELVERVPVP